MILIALDPGPERTGWCELHDGVIGSHGWDANAVVLRSVRGCIAEDDYLTVIESPQPQDNPLGPALRNTILWAGRYIEALEYNRAKYKEVDERDIRAWITGSRTGDNAALKQELKNIFGDKRQEPCGVCRAEGTVSGKRGAIKCKCCGGRKYVTLPGPLAKMNEHELSALAVAFVVQKQADIEAQRAEFKRVLTQGATG